MEAQNSFQKFNNAYKKSEKILEKAKIDAISKESSKKHFKLIGRTFNLLEPTFGGKPRKCCAGAQGRSPLKFRMEGVRIGTVIYLGFKKAHHIRFSQDPGTVGLERHVQSGSTGALWEPEGKCGKRLMGS